MNLKANVEKHIGILLFIVLILIISYLSKTVNELGVDYIENERERVNGILKDELLEQRFETFSEAQRKVAVAISTYNHLRPHSSIDMLTPAVAHTKSGKKTLEKLLFSKKRKGGDY